MMYFVFYDPFFIFMMCFRIHFDVIYDVFYDPVMCFMIHFLFL